MYGLHVDMYTIITLYSGKFSKGPNLVYILMMFQSSLIKCTRVAKGKHLPRGVRGLI